MHCASKFAILRRNSITLLSLSKQAVILMPLHAKKKNCKLSSFKLKNTENEYYKLLGEYHIVKAFILHYRITNLLLPNDADLATKTIE